MKTFRPAGAGGGTTSLQSPLSSGALRTPRDAAAALDQSRRDSGVLFEQDEAEPVNTRPYGGAGGGGGGAGQEGECLERDDDEHDSYHESIVVPKFNFQSLSLVNKSGLNMQSSGLSHSRSSGLSGGGRGRTRKSRSSMDSLEFEHLDQLLESMNIQNDSLHHQHHQPQHQHQHHHQHHHQQQPS